MKKIKLFWCTSKFEKNFGDELSPYIVKKISNREVICLDPIYQPNISIFNKLISLLSYIRNYSFFKLLTNLYYRHTTHLLAIGSIINQANSHSLVWGSGIINKDEHVESAKFLAVRGPLTRSHLLNLGYYVPDKLGDPGLLIKKFYKPKSIKKIKIGIIPHTSDYNFINQFITNPDIVVIDLRTEFVEELIDIIYSCNLIISSSLHGIIVSHSYDIPALWFKFKDSVGGDDIKFLDYFLSVNIDQKIPFSFGDCNINDPSDIELFFSKHQKYSLPANEFIEMRCNELIESFPK
jgi:hypothetical protein